MLWVHEAFLLARVECLHHAHIRSIPASISPISFKSSMKVSTTLRATTSVVARRGRYNRLVSCDGEMGN